MIEQIAALLHNSRPKCYEAFGNEDEGCYCVVNARKIVDLLAGALLAELDQHAAGERS